MARTLNNALPDDLVVKTAAAAVPGFHSRYSATSRTYRYVILNRDVPSALLGRFAFNLRAPLDLEAMRAASQLLIGSHEFAAFGKVEEVAIIRDSRDRGMCPPIAPAKGLCLVRVDYSGQRING
jgi:tRNA pseudouridine38-40 synthase